MAALPVTSSTPLLRRSAALEQPGAGQDYDDEDVIDDPELLNIIHEQRSGPCQYGAG